MIFEEAVKHVVNGEYIQRNAWTSTGEYVVGLPGIPYMWKILPNSVPNPSAGNWMPCIADLMADDYQVMKKVLTEENAAVA